MRYSRYHIFPTVIFAAAFFFVSAGTAFSAEPRIYFDFPEETIAPESPFRVQLFIESTDEPINAVSATFSYSPDVLELESINTASSVIDIWTEETGMKEAGIITLEGGAREPFEGEDGVFAELVFRGKSLGTAQISLEEGTLYIADGSGTPAPVSRAIAFVSVAEDGRVLAEGDIPDTNPPELRETELSINPLSGERIIAFTAGDNESGVRETSARFRTGFFWSPWESVATPVHIEDGVWAAQVRAVDNYGNAASVTKYVPSEIIWKILLIIALVSVLVWITLYVQQRKGVLYTHGRNKEKSN